MEIVKVQALSHSYNNGRNWAACDISFSIQSAGVIGLLGSNGAGKSTTMNIIAAVLNQSKGAVLINGYDTRKHPLEAKRHLGFLPQSPPLYLDLTVQEYLLHCARLRLMDKRQVNTAVEEVMEKVQLGHFRKRLIKNLSGGYRQRVGIAQAIVHRPKLVILDEPTVGLDPNQIQEVRKLVQEIALDRAVLFSTHILTEVDLMCRDVIMIEGGQVIFSGSLQEFRQVDTPETILVTLDTVVKREEVLAIEGVTEVEYLNDQKLRIKFKGHDMTQRILQHAVACNWPLREIAYEQKSLDQIFSKLSGKKPVLKPVASYEAD